jgi:hypothetical protein
VFGVKGLVLFALLASAATGPSGAGGKVTKEQLEYSKKMFAEGDAAMKKGDYQTAYTKFADGYRYAPHLHAFTFNIAAAAEALGDCKLAKKYYQMFYDLVAEHPERGKVKKKLADYEKTCIEDPESTEIISESAEMPTSASSSKAAREAAEADRSLNEAFFQLRVAQAAYADGKKRFPKAKNFRAPARRKKWDVKRMAKLLASYGVKQEEREVPAPELPAELKAACRIAKVQENRTLRALELALEKWDTDDAYRSLSRIIKRGASDLEKFKGCS